MANTYTILKQKHQTEVDNFPIGFAFSDKQFEEAMEKLGLKVTDTDKVLSIGGGGFIRKTDSEAFGNMFERHEKEMKEAIEADTTGEGFILGMFDYELANHEYCITWELDDTLRALDLTIDEVKASPALSHGLKLARSKY